MKISLSIVMPVHNEQDAIAGTIEDFARAAQQSQISVQFIVCEDGSSDRSLEVLRELEKRLPISIISSSVRKGYSKAVLDGLLAARSEWVLVVDSDGQCDPRDLSSFLSHRDRADLVVGYRNPRADVWARRLMSFAFKLVYGRLFPVRLRDPSCPYLLIRRSQLELVLQGRVGILKQGFWWEFEARAQATGCRVHEVSVRHRPRATGQSRVYRPGTIVRIGIEHLRGLIQLRKELSSDASNR